MGVLTDNLRLKNGLDSAALEYERWKLSQAREQAAVGMADRAAQAKRRISEATDRRSLDAAFRKSAHDLQR